LWIESGAPYPGTYAALGSGMIGRSRGPVEGWGPETEAVLQKRCGECHKEDRRLPLSPGDDVLQIGFGGAQLNHKDPRFRYSNHILYNLSRPEQSLLLRIPLALDAGGLAMHPVDPEQEPHPALFATTDDPDYRILLGAVQATAAQLNRIKRFDMPGFRPNQHYLREMAFYGVLPADLGPDDPVDAYAADRAYWDSFIYRPAPSP